MYLAPHLPHPINNEKVDRLGAEWHGYQMADIPKDWIKTSTHSSNNTIEYASIDKFWYRMMFSVTALDARQYVVLIKLVKCLLSLSHDNGDIERGFSQDNHLVLDDRASSNEASINGLSATNVSAKFFGGSKYFRLI